jgi:hypothetical protein
MARTETVVEDTSIIIPADTTGRVEQAVQAVNALAAIERQIDSNAHAVARQLGYEGALSVGALEDEIRFYQRRTAEACIELGKRLLILKELSPHGEFKQRVELLGFAYRTASKFMQAAVRTSKSAGTALLSSQVSNATKFLELLVLDDEDIAELNDGGTVAGLKLDDVARMSTSELRAALRTQREKTDELAKAKDDVIKGKGEFINTLEEKLATALNKKADKSEAAQDTRIADARLELQEVANQVKIDIMIHLRVAVQKLIEDTPGQHIQLAAACLIEIGRELGQLRDDFNLPRIISDTAPLDATWAAITAEQEAE